MIVRHVECAYWMERGGRRCAKAVYVFDDGFESLEEAKKAVENTGCHPENFRYVRFCNGWYAVYVRGYSRNVVISSECIKGNLEAFQETHEITASPELFASPSVPDRKPWQHGIVHDLLLADENIAVCTADGNDERSAVMTNNVIITFGIQYFASELCIRSDSYVRHVFSRYFNPLSMEYIWQDIRELRDSGIEYYNPFIKTSSKNYSEQRKKLLKRCGGKVPECIMDPAPDREAAKRKKL